MGNGDTTRDFDDVVVECGSDVIKVGKYKSFGEVETYCDDVLCVFAGEFLDVGDCQVGFEEEFFVVGELDYEGDIKNILQPPAVSFQGYQERVKVGLCEGEWDDMADVHGVT